MPSKKIQSLKAHEFIINAKKLRGNKFEYSRVEYINNTTSVLIGCPDHGFLPQVPWTQLRNRTNGCKECGRVWQRNKTLRKRTEAFFKRCKQKYKNKFDYSQTVFETLSKKIEFGCPDHGHYSLFKYIWRPPLAFYVKELPALDRTS